MPDESNEPLPEWLAKALSEIPWEEVRIPHLPLRLKPGLAERDERIAELIAERDAARRFVEEQVGLLREARAEAERLRLCLRRVESQNGLPTGWLEQEHGAKMVLIDMNTSEVLST
jgi:hypothetical protein